MLSLLICNVENDDKDYDDDYLDDCKENENNDSGRTHPTAWLTRSSWAPTIGRHSLGK